MTLYSYYGSDGIVAMYSQSAISSYGNLTELISTISDDDYRNLTVNNYRGTVSGGVLTIASIRNDYNPNVLISKVTGVNARNVAQTTLYTVPTGYYLMIFDVVIVVTAADTATVGASLSIGTSGRSYTDWCGTTATSLYELGKSVNLASASTLPRHQIFSAGEVVKVDITTGATATTLTYDFYVMGMLISA